MGFSAVKNVGWQNVLNKLLRKGKGPKGAKYDQNYGNKVVFYEDWMGQLDDELLAAGSAVDEVGSELRTIEPATKKAGSPTEVGGIDMREKTMNLDLRGKAGTFILPADPAQIQNIRIDGLVPVINSMTPVSDLSAFLKLGQMSHEKQDEPAFNSG